MSRLTVNERPVEFDLDPRTPLLFALREAANLTGTKSCGSGPGCTGGACTVIIDGAALRSCAVSLAEAEGRYVTTIEGLSRTRSHPVQQAMVAEQAIQCGFCTPGIVMAAAALIARNPAPTRAEIEAAVPKGRVALRRERLSAAPAPGISAEDAAAAVPALSRPAGDE